MHCLCLYAILTLSLFTWKISFYSHKISFRILILCNPQFAKQCVITFQKGIFKIIRDLSNRNFLKSCKISFTLCHIGKLFVQRFYGLWNSNLIYIRKKLENTDKLSYDILNTKNMVRVIYQIKILCRKLQRAKVQSHLQDVKM